MSFHRPNPPLEMPFRNRFGDRRRLFIEVARDPAAPFDDASGGTAIVLWTDHETDEFVAIVRLFYRATVLSGVEALLSVVDEVPLLADQVRSVTAFRVPYGSVGKLRVRIAARTAEQDFPLP